MQRSILYDEEQADPFDILWQFKDIVFALGHIQQDIAGSIATVASGLAATPTAPTSLILNIAAGRVYQQGPVDPTPYGALPTDTAVIQLQGTAPAQTVQLSTAALSSGQSMWALVQAQISQTDIVRPTDPTGGVLNYWNAADPTQPFQGPNNDGSPQPTERQVGVTLSVVYGTAATTGSEVPPNPTSGFIPLYLVDLAFGQTTIASNQILVAGPSVGSNVPSNYPAAPFLAGLLNAHHSGGAGQAPQIDLTKEVKNALPLANVKASNTAGGGLPVLKLGAGNPNGSVAGNFSVNGASDFYWDTTNLILYICTVTGSTSTSVWTAVVGGSTSIFAGGTATGTVNAQVVASTTPSGFARTPGQVVTFTGLNNTSSATLNVDATGAATVQKVSGGSNVNLSGGELNGFVSVVWTGTVYLLNSAILGALATLNIGAWLKNDGSGNLTIKNGLALADDGSGNLTVAAGGILPAMLSAAGAPLPYVGTQTAGDNLHITNDATNPNFAFNVTVGRVRDDTDITNLQLSAAMTKRLDQSWAGGTGNGACDASTKSLNQTWHLYLIGKTGMAPTAISRTSNVATMTIAGHGLGAGSPFRVAGQGAGFDGLAVATSVTTNSITWSNAGGNVGSGAPAATATVDGFDILGSQAYPSPAMPSGWNAKQYLWSLHTDGSANIRPMTMIGDKCIFSSPSVDYGPLATTAGGSRLSVALASMPNHISVSAIFNAQLNSLSAGCEVLFTTLAQTDVAPGGSTNGSLTGNSSAGVAGQFEIVTDASQSIGVRASSTAATITITPIGYRNPLRRLF